MPYPVIPEAFTTLATDRIYAIDAGRCEYRKDWPLEERGGHRLLIWGELALSTAITYDHELAKVMTATKWAEGL